MSISNINPSAKDVVIIQRSDDNTQYNETHISGAKAILHIDANGYINADDSSSFYTLYPPPGGGGSGGSSLSSSWASQSFSSSFAVSASWAPGTGGGTSESASWASRSFYATSASFASKSLSSSLATSASIINVTNNSVQSASYNITFVTASGGYQQLYIDDQQGVFSYNPGTDTLIVSNISSSGEVVVPNPVNPQDAATKQYVDDITQFGFDYYFRTASADVAGYEYMYDINTPISASNLTLVSTAVAANQYIFSFISPPLGLTNIDPGAFTVHFHIYRTGGVAATGVHAELYIRSASVENEIGAGADVIITTTTTDSYTEDILITSSISLNTTDRLVCKIKSSAATAGAPTITTTIEGSTAAGVTVPIGSANFVLKTGDVMFGPLTNSYGFYGTSSWANSASATIISISSSYSPWSDYARSSSWTSQSFSTSYSPFSDYATSASWASRSLFSTSGSWANQSFSTSYSPFSDYVTSASWASASYSSSFTPYAKPVVLCSAYSPPFTGADTAEVAVPFHPTDGITPTSWSLRRLVFRAQTPEAFVSNINIEKSVGTGQFNAILISSASLASGSYEVNVTGSIPFGSASVAPIAGLVSGEKLRFNVTTLGSSQNWTIITELSNI